MTQDRSRSALCWLSSCRLNLSTLQQRCLFRRMAEDNDSHSMLKRRLLRGEITYAAAKEQDSNILHELGYRDQKIRYFTHLYRNRKLIESIVAHHLNLPSADTCHAVDVEEWIHGSFNVCIRVEVDSQGRDPRKQLMIRFPLPYRIGENSCPGNADEKVRCEAGTYSWLQENCPTIPIPQLYGFGLSTGQTVCPRFACLLGIIAYNPSSQSSITCLS